jgi:hypothetical protein
MADSEDCEDLGEFTEYKSPKITTASDLQKAIAEFNSAREPFTKKKVRCERRMKKRWQENAKSWMFHSEPRSHSSLQECR